MRSTVSSPVSIRSASNVRFAKLIFLQLDKIFYLGFYAPILNLDHINQAMLTPIDGILGNNILRKTTWHD